MDSEQDARDYDAMDHAAVNRQFAEDFLAAAESAGVRLDPPDAEMLAEILDIGTGTAQIPIELLRSRPRLRILAIDLAQSMLEVGRRNVAGAGLTAQVRLECVDAKALPYPADSFAAVISNSIVHHIPDPRRVLADACRVLAPGGLLFVRDLSRPASDDAVRSLVERYAAEANEHQRQLFDASLRAALNVDEVRQLVSGLRHDPAAVRQTSDRHWTWTMHRPAD
jgi:ubiquinone/menaquinone biosynthesis C-methylase UbiE